MDLDAVDKIFAVRSPESYFNLHFGTALEGTDGFSNGAEQLTSIDTSAKHIHTRRRGRQIDTACHYHYYHYTLSLYTNTIHYHYTLSIYTITTITIH